MLTYLRAMCQQPKLRVLYATQNLIAKMSEFDVLKECKALEVHALSVPI